MTGWCIALALGCLIVGASAGTLLGLMVASRAGERRADAADAVAVEAGDALLLATGHPDVAEMYVREARTARTEGTPPNTARLFHNLHASAREQRAA